MTGIVTEASACSLADDLLPGQGEGVASAHAPIPSSCWRRHPSLSLLSRVESRVDEARARFHLGDFIAARDIASRVLTERPRWLTAQTILVAALWNLGSDDEARVIARRMLASHPNLTASRWARGLPYCHQTDLDALVTPLRLAGLPE